MKTEAALKAALTKMSDVELLGFYHFYVAGVGEDGIPDRAYNGYGRTSWWEIKHATPTFDSPGHQELCCLKLAATTVCRYLVYFENADGTRKCTFIYHPREVQGKHGRVRDMVSEASVIGHDHRWACAQIRKWHQP